MDNVFVAAAVAGVVQCLKLLRDKNWIGAVTIVIAAAIGVLAGLAEIEGLDVQSGLIAGLAASGVYTVVSKIG